MCVDEDGPRSVMKIAPSSSSQITSHRLEISVDTVSTQYRLQY